ncbi:type III polyketide synthase [Sphingomonas sp. CGMCC 1.13654]|uniref:Type III polyketide synthase n=1 Tax=Sphingomonas chungangi TaxID=2683589 RepID=A0A838L754_9SPHN|nr:type III polyketide synthase [Sphingomonas chungangi]MBA2934329.1 type III polyketide synthase [Sphingomonas chungangi]MVW57369.1 type III polyketide synthase [Sphingomonas chungangi]
MTAVAHINRIGTALPPHQVHDAFVGYVAGTIADEKHRKVFERMVARAGIERRFSYLRPDGRVSDGEPFYAVDGWPGTAERMSRYEAWAPELAMEAIGALGLDIGERVAITHLVVASCTGFMAPGLDQIIMARAGLNPGVERTLVGFMGCYAAVNALRVAHHIVRSTPEARVLVVNLELCTLHFQQTDDLERLLSMLLFGDGCTAALVTAEPEGIALNDFRAATIAETAGSITWRIGGQGFDMHLGGEVPGHIGRALADELARGAADGLLRAAKPGDYDLWAVHAGGRSILDAVEQGFGLAPDALDWSRGVLRDFGNMSSATLMFVLARMLAGRGDADRSGFAIAFGPGLAAESFRFTLLARP